MPDCRPIVRIGRIRYLAVLPGGSNEKMRAGSVRCALALCLLAAGAAAQEMRGAKAPPPAEESLPTRYHARIIAIETYEKPGAYGNLGTPLADADALAELLPGFGFESVSVLRDEQATKNAIEHLLQDLAGDTFSDDDNLLIYFAGHGEREEGESYWLPWDMREKDPVTWISGTVIKQYLERIAARHVLLVSDSCYSGGLARGKRARPDDVLVETLLKRPSYQVITSGGNQPVADSATGSANSLFAALLLKELEGALRERRDLVADDLFAELRQRVSNLSGKSGQLPWMGRINLLRDDGGEFVFRPAGKELTNVVVDRSWPKDLIVPGKLLKRGDDVYALKGVDEDCEMILVRPGMDDGLRPFLIDRYEVTNRRFAKFLAARQRPAELHYWGLEEYVGDDKPVVGVPLELAREFAEWAGKRLPTERQWTYAALFDQEQGAWRRYPWGNEFAGKLERLRFPPLVTKTADDLSPWKVCGMGGGVYEWCEPDEPQPGYGVIRGGSQVLTRRGARIEQATSETRLEAIASEARPNVGFRCVYVLR